MSDLHLLDLTCVLEFSDIKMPRVCSFCGLGKDNSPDLSMFMVERGDGTSRLVCERHFSPEDLVTHGNFRR